MPPLRPQQHTKTEMKTKTKLEAAEYIDVTPTWAGILPLLLAGAENGVQSAREELLRMARLADAYVAAKKGGAL